MAWGAIISAGIGAAGSLFGASSANKQAKEAARLSREQMAMQRDFADRQFDMADRAFDFTLQENEYQKAVEALNRQIADENFEFGVNELRQYQLDLISERQYDINRQIKLDQDAAKQRMDQLTERLRNQDLAGEERERALAELEDAQAIARGERTQDLRQFYETQVALQAEQRYMRDQYEGALARASDERAYDMRFRDDLVGRIDGMRSSLRQVQDSFGEAPELYELTPYDIEAEIGRRTSEYQEDVDRAAERVASVNEADLIASGMDESTTGTARRGEIAGRLADEYQNARQRAYDEALSFVTGKTGALNQNANERFARRGDLLGETANIEGAGIDQLISLPGLSSTVDATRFASAIPSAAYDRDIVSANNYRAPLAVNSAIYDRMTPGSGMGTTINTRSRAVGNGMNMGRQIISPYGSANPASSTAPFMSGAGSAINSGAGLAASNFNGAVSRAGDAWSGFGSNFRDLTDELGSWWDNRSSGGPTIAQKKAGS